MIITLKTLWVDCYLQFTQFFCIYLFFVLEPIPLLPHSEALGLSSSLIDSLRSAGGYEPRLLSNYCSCLGSQNMFCVALKNGIFHSSLGLLKASPTGFQSYLFWGLFFLVQSPQAGEAASSDSAPWGASPHYHFCCRPGFRSMGLDYIAFQLSYSISLGPFLYMQLQKIFSYLPVILTNNYSLKKL